MRKELETAAEWIKAADALLITAGAGMGVDSGLPDFRGDKGFWKSYPMYERLGINFIGAANPAHFHRDPEFGWGFYGHRLNLYRKTVPHLGFKLILDWIKRYRLDYFVVTSNVDGQFQKAGFRPDRIEEIHGSIHHLQCLKPCTDDIWENKESVQVDLTSMRAKRVPTCPYCGGVARPNILMFGDFSWIGSRSDHQFTERGRFTIRNQDKRVVVIEMGAGTAIPSIRHTTESWANFGQTRILRINPRQPQIPEPHIGVGAGALETLLELEAHL